MHVVVLAPVCKGECGESCKLIKLKLQLQVLQVSLIDLHDLPYLFLNGGESGSMRVDECVFPCVLQKADLQRGLARLRSPILAEDRLPRHRP